MRMPSHYPLNRYHHKWVLALALAMPAVHQAAQAAPGLSVDPGAAQQAGLALASGGTPIVNIVAPDRNGLSHNTFTEFNVGQAGLILNNSSKAGQTVLGGTIAGNSQLGGQSANVILNEVTGKGGSSIQGMLEVAGRGAHVIIANPNGITANGADFINANRVSLVAGQTLFDKQGALAGYKTEQGQIRIVGAGLNASKAEQIDLIARTLQINAALHAKSLGLIAQEGSVEASKPGSYNISGGSYDSEPVVALDVGQLGSVHANSIYMVASSAGVGVNVSGKVHAVAGNLDISSAGKVQLASGAELNAQNRLSVTGDLDNKGEIRSGASMRLSGVSVVNSHVIHSADKLAISASTIHNQATGTITGVNGLTTSGSLRNEGALKAPNIKPEGGVAAKPTNKPVVTPPIIKPQAAFEWAAMPQMPQMPASGFSVSKPWGAQSTNSAVAFNVSMQQGMGG